MLKAGKALIVSGYVCKGSKRGGIPGVFEHNGRRGRLSGD